MPDPKGPRRYTDAQAEWAGVNLNPKNRGKGRKVNSSPLTAEERRQLAELLGLPPEEVDGDA